MWKCYAWIVCGDISICIFKTFWNVFKKEIDTTKHKLHKSLKLYITLWSYLTYTTTAKRTYIIILKKCIECYVTNYKHKHFCKDKF